MGSIRFIERIEQYKYILHPGAIFLAYIFEIL